MKKLILAKETLRRLGTQYLQHVAGAMPGEGWTMECPDSQFCVSDNTCDRTTCPLGGTVTRPTSVTTPIGNLHRG